MLWSAAPAAALFNIIQGTAMHRVARAALIAAAVLFGTNAMSETIQMKIGEAAYPIELLENDAARSLSSRLPLALQFEDFGSTERIAYLNPKLSVGSSPMRTTPQTGDLAYYMPWGNLAAFVKPFRESEGLVPLGKIPPEAIRALKECRDAVVRFERAGSD